MTTEQTFQCSGEAAMVALGERLGRASAGGAVIFLQGNLGIGKTTLCRGVLRGLGHRGAVKSPTYTLVEPYELAGVTAYHFDLYRLGDPEELEYMGIRDYFEGNNICLIEWPDKGVGCLPPADLMVAIKGGGEQRELLFTAATPQGAKVLAQL
jgi:tRNA threonylcarbamoyladenosine biosynthesis protein TsaE